MKSSIPSDDNRIEAIIFVEFDNQVGAKMSHQVPQNFFDDRTFKSLETYFIARTLQLNDRLIVTELENLKTIGIPVRIQHSHAVQNGREVSILDIVIVTKLAANTTPYEKILKKLISYLKIFEQENRFLSSEGMLGRIQEILDSIYHGINNYGYCSVNCSVNVIDELNVIKLSYINMMDYNREPPVIKDSDVPIVIGNLKDSSAWDLSLRELYGFFDNQKPIKLLADKSRMHIRQVKKCVQSLIYYNLAAVISPIQYSNTYYVTAAIHSIMNNRALQEECIRYVRISEDKPGPSWESIFSLYETFQTGIQLKKLFMVETPFRRNVNERRLVEYGLVKGILKRLHKYPIYKNSTGGEPPEEIQEYIQAGVLDGQHSFDDICVKLKLRLIKVQYDLESCSRYVVVIQKLGV